MPRVVHDNSLMPVETLVLVSGGLDSAVLAAHEAQTACVHLLYVSVGLAWEHAELSALDHLVRTPVLAGFGAALTRVAFNMRDVYSPSHWAIRGAPPADDTPDEDVYLVGRNLVLLTKAGVVAAHRHAGRIVMGPLVGNPFPDARPVFFDAMAQAMSLGLDRQIEVATPFASWRKEDVIRRGRELGVPLEMTLSCMNPMGPGPSGAVDSAGDATAVPVHCGTCSKCGERRRAFVAAGGSDPTAYAAEQPDAGRSLREVWPSRPS